MLPFKSKLNLHSYLHLHLQGSVIKKNTSQQHTDKPFSRQKMNNLLQSLEDGIRSFSFSQPSATWSNYYEEASQRGDYVEAKKQIIGNWLNRLQARTVLDAGANIGEFSKLASSSSSYIISIDSDHSSVNKLYNNSKQTGHSFIHPLVVDLAAPSPAIGVNNKERHSFLERTNVDLVLALALIHHLALGKNIPFEKIAELFSSMGEYLVIEFVPNDDEKVKLMTLHKQEVCVNYTEDNFIESFARFFSVVEKQEVGSSGRNIYLMKKQNA